jgi:exonuclease III
MKLISWNCNMAFRKKADAILRHRPDILILQECEHPSKINFDLHIKAPKSVLWFGNNPHKGMGILRIRIIA